MDCAPKNIHNDLTWQFQCLLFKSLAENYKPMIRSYIGLCLLEHCLRI